MPCAAALPPLQEHLEEWDVINHLTWPNSYPDNHTCWDNGYRRNNMRKCKYIGLEFYMTNVRHSTGGGSVGRER